MRVYEKNKYAFIKFYTFEKNDKNEKKEKSESKTGNDEVMSHVWKLMKYTQGENESKTCMKLVNKFFISFQMQMMRIKKFLNCLGDASLCSRQQRNRTRSNNERH